jgi:hypothetical protein
MQIDGSYVVHLKERKKFIVLWFLGKNDQWRLICEAGTQVNIDLYRAADISRRTKNEDFMFGF